MKERADGSPTPWRAGSSPPGCRDLGRCRDPPVRPPLTPSRRFSRDHRMRLLVAIPHYFSAARSKDRDDRGHGSLGQDPQPRIEALSECLSALHQQFVPTQCLINIEQGVAHAVNPAIASQVDIVVCTHACDHILPCLRLPADAFEQREFGGDPSLLGFECHRALRDRLGAYDY
jgi:hypothetical protein